MDKFDSYIASNGEAWDLVCYNTYGDGNEFLMQTVMRVNREYSDTLLFEGGESLRIPTLNSSPVIELDKSSGYSSTIRIITTPWSD